MGLHATPLSYLPFDTCPKLAPYLGRFCFHTKSSICAAMIDPNRIRSISACMRSCPLCFSSIIRCLSLWASWGLNLLHSTLSQSMEVDSSATAASWTSGHEGGQGQGGGKACCGAHYLEEFTFFIATTGSGLTAIFSGSAQEQHTGGQPRRLREILKTAQHLSNST